MAASKWSTSAIVAGLGQARVVGVGRAEPGGRERALHEALEAVVVEPGGGGLRDAAAVDDHPQPHVVLVAGHVLVDAAVGEPGEGAACPDRR